MLIGYQTIKSPTNIKFRDLEVKYQPDLWAFFVQQSYYQAVMPDKLSSSNSKVQNC